MSERSGVEIDYCPECRGVWLDRGELDKIIERSFGQASPAQAAPIPQGGGHHGRKHQSYGQGYGKPKRKESWLSELFD